jgi:hypothetical protein
MVRLSVKVSEPTTESIDQIMTLPLSAKPPRSTWKIIGSSRLISTCRKRTSRKFFDHAK